MEHEALFYMYLYVLQEVLMEHEALFYIDASVSLTEEMAQVNWKSIYKQAKSNGGMVLFWNTGFSCLGFTAPGTFCIIFRKDRLNI